MSIFLLFFYFSGKDWKSNNTGVSSCKKDIIALQKKKKLDTCALPLSLQTKGRKPVLGFQNYFLCPAKKERKKLSGQETAYKKDDNIILPGFSFFTFYSSPKKIVQRGLSLSPFLSPFFSLLTFLLFFSFILSLFSEQEEKNTYNYPPKILIQNKVTFLSLFSNKNFFLFLFSLIFLPLSQSISYLLYFSCQYHHFYFFLSEKKTVGRHAQSIAIPIKIHSISFMHTHRKKEKKTQFLFFFRALLFFVFIGNPYLSPGLVTTFGQWKKSQPGLPFGTSLIKHIRLAPTGAILLHFYCIQDNPPCAHIFSLFFSLSLSLATCLYCWRKRRKNIWEYKWVSCSHQLQKLLVSETFKHELNYGNKKGTKNATKAKHTNHIFSSFYFILDELCF